MKKRDFDPTCSFDPDRQIHTYKRIYCIWPSLQSREHVSMTTGPKEIWLDQDLGSKKHVSMAVGPKEIWLVQVLSSKKRFILFWTFCVFLNFLCFFGFFISYDPTYSRGNSMKKHDFDLSTGYVLLTCDKQSNAFRFFR
jgi:hypothetical protein